MCAYYFTKGPTPNCLKECIMFTIIIFLIYACDMKNFSVVLIDIEILENSNSLYSFTTYVQDLLPISLLNLHSIRLSLDINGNIDITMFMKFD